jgi:threonine dehydratase
VEVSGIAADALGATSIGQLAWNILSHSPTTSVVVSDEETITARQWMWDRFRLLIEHSAAVAVAAHHSNSYDTAGKRLGIIVCGANTSF